MKLLQNHLLHAKFNGRFEFSKKAENEGTFRAKTQGVRCPQTAESFGRGESSEDCLTLDIYKALPVGESDQQLDSVLVYYCDGAKTLFGNDESSEFENQYCGDSIEAWMGYSAFIGVLTGWTCLKTEKTETMSVFQCF